MVELSDKQNRIDANKWQKFFASRRSDIDLIEKSTKYGEAAIDQLRSELSDILESRNLNYPHQLKRMGLEESLSYKQRRITLGLRTTDPNPTQREIDFQHYMKKLAAQGRKGEWQWRIANHAEEYQAKGWYPFFVTLTVDPNNHDPEQLWKEGRAFRKYIRKLVNTVCSELGHPMAHKSNTPESEYVTYVGVLEHGKSRLHHHGHFLIWMREIPDSWKHCPNKGIKNPMARNKRECMPLRKYWPYSLPGLSPALYFRSTGDVWSKHGFAVPLNKGKPVNIGTPRQSGLYVTKYLGKDHREWKHRVKATRNLGTTRLRHKLSTMTDKEVEALTWRPPTSSLNHLVKMTHTVPQGLLRRTAKTEHFYRLYASNLLDLKTLTMPKSESYTRMLKSVRSGARPDRMGLKELFDWVTGHLPEIKEFSNTRFVESHKLLSDLYPVDRVRSKRIQIPGNNIGYT